MKHQDQSLVIAKAYLKNDRVWKAYNLSWFFAVDWEISFYFLAIEKKQEARKHILVFYLEMPDREERRGTFPIGVRGKWHASTLAWFGALTSPSGQVLAVSRSRCLYIGLSSSCPCSSIQWALICTSWVFVCISITNLWPAPNLMLNCPLDLVFCCFLTWLEFWHLFWISLLISTLYFLPTWPGIEHFIYYFPCIAFFCLLSVIFNYCSLTWSACIPLLGPQ